MPVAFQTRSPATPPGTLVVKTTETSLGSVQHVNVDNAEANPVSVAPASYHASPFGGFRVAMDFLVQEHFHSYPGVSTAYDTDFYGYESASGGAIAHIPNHSAVRLSVVDATNGAKSRLRTHDLVRYQTGAAPHIKITGYGSDGDLYSVIRSSASGSVVETRVKQDSWNENASAVDVTKANLYEIMYEWLGVGVVWYFVNGTLRQIVQNAGALTEPYMKTPNLPISVEVFNDGATQYIRFGQFDDSDGIFFEIQRTAGAGSFTYICSSARILNGTPYATLSYGFSHNLVGVGATLIPLFSLRMGTTFNGIDSRIFALPTLISCFAETREGAFALIMNPTLTGATWAATSPSSAVQIDTAATVLAGGTQIMRVGLDQDQSQAFTLTDIFTIPGTKIRRQAFTGTSDILTIGVIREWAVNFDPRATLTWREVH